MNILEPSATAFADRCVPMILRMLLVLPLATLGNAVGATSSAQPDAAPSGNPVFTLTGQVIANGGISRAGSPCFDLAASIGQPVSGSTQGGAYALYAGFLGDFNPHDSIFRSSFEVCQP